MALQEYNRFSDEARLARDSNVEVTEVFYPPHFESIEEAGIGDSDPVKVGAIATAVINGKTRAIVYQGGGVWLASGGGSSSIKNPALEYGMTSAQMNDLYPSFEIGDIAYSPSVVYKKISATEWSVSAIEIA